MLLLDQLKIVRKVFLCMPFITGDVISEALAKLRDSAGSPEHSLIASENSTEINSIFRNQGICDIAEPAL